MASSDHDLDLEVRRTRNDLALGSSPEIFTVAMERYFCLVELPSALKRREKSISCEASLKFFHFDYVATNLPIKGKISDLLHGITQGKISTLLFEHFRERLALDKGVYAYHWIPGTLLFDVEYDPGHWKKILVILVEKHSERFGAPIDNLWQERIQKQIVRDWDMLKAGLEGQMHREKTVPGSRKDEVTLINLVPHRNDNGEEQVMSLRGRKWRRARQFGLTNQLRANKIVVDLPKSQIGLGLKKELGISLINSSKRGRFRRQLRRNLSVSKSGVNGNKTDISVSKFGRNILAATSKNLEVAEQGPPRHHAFQTGWNLLHNGHDLPSLDATNLEENAISLSIGRSSLTIQSNTIKNQPLLTIAPHKMLNKAGHQEVTMQHYLLISGYKVSGKSQNLQRTEKDPWRVSSSSDRSFNQKSIEGDEEGDLDLDHGASTSSRNARERSGADSSEVDLTSIEMGYSTKLDHSISQGSSEGPESRLEEFISAGNKEGIILAQLVDYTGLIAKHTQSFFNYGYICSVGADPSSAKLNEALSVNSYWMRLALLIMGEAGYRNLPYSQGYGARHFNPSLIRREWRSGFLDVDTSIKNSNLPRWRAAWTFDYPAEIPDCECKLSCNLNVRHNIDSCRHLVQRERSNPIRILHEALYYAHLPWECFEHKKLEIVEEPPAVSETSRYDDIISSMDWDSAQNRVRPDVDYSGYISDPAQAASYTINKIIIETGYDWKEMQKRKDVEFPFEHGLTHLMGMGTPKNIDLGLEWILTAAERGCVKARGTVTRLFHLYNRKLQKSHDTLRQWLSQAAIQGSDVGLQDLKQFYSESEEYKNAVQQLRFCFNPQWPRSLQYQQHVLPHIDLSRTQFLREMVEKANTHSEFGHPEQSQEAKDAAHYLAMKFISDRKPAYSGEYAYGSLLHLACLFGFDNAVEIFIDAGLDINQFNSSRKLRTPLLCALRRGYHRIARILIKRGADCRPLPAWEPTWLYYPSPLHYLVYIEDENAAAELAELLVSHGGEVNNMCKASVLDTSDLWSLVGSYSVTPLRWAVMHNKAALVRKLLQLGATFASSPFWSTKDASKSNTIGNEKFCLLLETPCTNPEILALFFEQLGLSVLPLEFSQTPLGLLVSEDDTPERRLRLGFGEPALVITALDLLLDLQPGYEDELMWSVVRHNHLGIVKHLIDSKHWSLETRWRGLTCLHTAVLYGHRDMVKLLLWRGADATIVTSTRQLNCFHLLMLVRRDRETDIAIFESLVSYGIGINEKERSDNLTPIHIAVRNRKLHLISLLLKNGANPHIPVQDQLELLAEGRSGFLKNSTSRPQKMTEDVTIIGEVLFQCNQDNFYSIDYVESLLKLLLHRDKDEDHLTAMPPLYIDSARTISILHLMAMIPFPDTSTVFTFVLSCFPKSAINVRDSYGDTPLHYACLSHQARNVKALLDLGANPSSTNNLNLTPIQAMTVSSIILGPFIWGFQKSSSSGNPAEMKEIHKRERKTREALEHMKRYNSRFKNRKSSHTKSTDEIFALFDSKNSDVEDSLKQLAMAWSHLFDESGEDIYLSLVPMKLGDNAKDSTIGKSNEELSKKTAESAETESHLGGFVRREESKIDVSKATIDLLTHFKLHRTDSPDLMICHHEDYDWSSYERGNIDFFGRGKGIEVPIKLAGGRPIFEIYGYGRES